jgi:hypothetical protein
VTSVTLPDGSALELSRYYTHEELGTQLRRLAAAYPQLARLEAIGQSHRGRAIWLMRLTNFATGDDRQRPAFLIDANNHGEEVVTSAAALYTLAYALSSYGRDAAVTELLDTRALYVIPRLNPDGAEISLTTPYRTVGNGHYLPWEEQEQGLHLEDVDNDGRILQMRLPHPAGEWKAAEADPRLLVLRQPGELGGRYYRLLPEGLLRDWDGLSLPIAAPRHGNLNRQFPANWIAEHGEYGAGELPLNEPEAAALARFALDHPNLTGVHSYHSHGGVLLRPSGYRRDAELPAEDVDLFKQIGQAGTALTGYPLISTFEDFTESLRSPRHGTFTDWAYEQLGLLALAPELWHVERAAGLERKQFFDARARDEEEQLALLRWAEEHSPTAFTPWRPFEHPQLGPLEIGGWDPFLLHRNPPPQLLATVMEPICRFSLHQAAASPLLRIVEARAEPLGHGFFKLVAGVENQGYLATYVSQQAHDHGLAAPVTLRLELAEGVSVLMGAPEQGIGHLAGRVTRRTAWDPWRRPWGEPARRVEWLLQLAPDTIAQVTIHVAAAKGGIDQVKLTLDTRAQAVG